MKLSIVILLLAFLQLTGNSQNSTVRKAIIEPMLGSENYEHFRRLVMISPDSEITWLDGLDFEWGYRYIIRVRETALEGYLSDGTRFEYEYIDVVSKEKVTDTVFKLFISPTRYYYELPPEEAHLNQTLIRVNDTTYNYMEKVDILVPVDLIPEIENIVQTKKGRLGYFTFAESGRIRLVHF